MDLHTPLTYVKGVGPARAAMLEAKGLVTVEDLLAYVPFRYEDRSNVKTIAQLAPGEMATVIAEVRSAKLSGFQAPQPGLVRSALHATPRAPILVGKWFHGGYLAERAGAGHEGRAVRQGGVRQLLRRAADDASGVRDSLRRRRGRRCGAACRPRRAGLRSGGQVTTRVLRTLMHRILAELPPVEDHLPAISAPALEAARPLDRASASRTFPPPDSDLRLLNAFRSPAQFRLIFEEFFWLECGLALKRSKARTAAGNRVRAQRPRARADQGDAAVQAHRRAEARAAGDRRRYEGSRIP